MYIYTIGNLQNRGLAVEGMASRVYLMFTSGLKVYEQNLFRADWFGAPWEKEERRTASKDHLVPMRLSHFSFASLVFCVGRSREMQVLRRITEEEVESKEATEAKLSPGGSLDGPHKALKKVLISPTT